MLIYPTDNTSEQDYTYNELHSRFLSFSPDQVWWAIYRSIPAGTYHWVRTKIYRSVTADVKLGETGIIFFTRWRRT